MLQQLSRTRVPPRNSVRSQPIEMYGPNVSHERQEDSDCIEAIRPPCCQRISKVTEHFHGLIPHHKSQYEATDQRQYRTRLAVGFYQS
jgi:hypothetical protein